MSQRALRQQLDPFPSARPTVILQQEPSILLSSYYFDVSRRPGWVRDCRSAAVAASKVLDVFDTADQEIRPATGATGRLIPDSLALPRGTSHSSS